jgi:vacuolar-type H+-ATPase subunit E/Vma4
MRAASPPDVAGLISRLEERARAEIAEKRRRTAEAIAQLEQEAAAARRAHRDDMLRECDERVEADASAPIDAAALEARRELLDAQHVLVGEVLERALSRLPTLVSADCLNDEQLGRRLRNAMAYTDDTTTEVRCRHELAERVRAIIATEWPGSRVVVDDGATGIRVLDGGGRLTIDDTLETRLERSRTELAIEICRAAEPEQCLEEEVT